MFMNNQVKSVSFFSIVYENTNKILFHIKLLIAISESGKFPGVLLENYSGIFSRILLQILT